MTFDEKFVRAMRYATGDAVRLSRELYDYVDDEGDFICIVGAMMAEFGYEIPDEDQARWLTVADLYTTMKALDRHHRNRPTL